MKQVGVGVEDDGGAKNNAVHRDVESRVGIGAGVGPNGSKLKASEHEDEAGANQSSRAAQRVERWRIR